MDRRRNGARVWDPLIVFPRTACGFIACRFSIRWKAFSGSRPSCFHRQGEARVLWLAGQLRVTIRKERDDGQHIGRIRNPTRVCLRVTMGTSEVDTTR